MAYSEEVADRVREVLADAGADVAERKMFGGLAFMVGGHMAVGVLGDELMVRVGRDAHEAALAEPHARTMDFTGKPMVGMVYVAGEGLRSDAALRAWIRCALEFTATLPPR